MPKSVFGAQYQDVYLVAGARTPFGKFCGTLGTVNPTDLGIIASRGLFHRTGIDPALVDHVVFANIIQAGFDALYLPRHIALYSGIPRSVPALMVQRICGSGFESIIAGVEQILLEKASLVLAGGSENMTLAPTASFGNRLGYRLGAVQFRDMLWEGLLDPASGCTMGMTAENLARKYGLTREEVDAFAFESHSRALRAQQEGVLAQEIIPVHSDTHELEGLAPRKFRLNPSRASLDRDENIRETSLEKLAQLPPTFAKDGVQTAGNSSGIVDGAAAVLVASGAVVRELPVEPLAQIVASSSVGVDPEIMGIGPAPAIRNVLRLSGLNPDDIGLYEINEAFGAQIVAVMKELELDPANVNVNGGAIAIGHPLAATGTRLTHTLALEMQRRGVRYGIASACIGGGQGTAILLENTEV
ncbi:MAG: thiolase family protein [Candidatus Neomarinimicrobiota bacterium]|nr:MAG: thiolase family protein [Candidatus Neomarinimicrobiota bacterium]